MKWDLALIALAVLAVAAISRRLTNTSVTPAMAFVAIGLLLGPWVTGEIDAAPTSHSVRTLAEATLAVVLFSDASGIDLRALRREYDVPLRLLGIGLPLTIAAGLLAGGLLLRRIPLTDAVVLAVVLAPTDAALGQAVVTEPRLPSRIRQGLNVESGLNDGICVPLLLIALAAADARSNATGGQHAWTVVAEQIGYGLAGGAAAGLLASAVVIAGERHRLISDPWLPVISLAAAGLAYGLAAPLGGSGFIAAFVAGLAFGGLTGHDVSSGRRLSEEVGDLLGGVTFLMFGAILLGPALEHLQWQELVYALLSLTVVRMLPVAVAMIGSGARPPTLGFLGWFGPRGLASIVFAVIAVDQARLPGVDTVLVTTYLTIGISVMAHGASAAPLATRYARWSERHPPPRQPPAQSEPAVDRPARAGR